MEGAPPACEGEEWQGNWDGHIDAHLRSTTGISEAVRILLVWSTYLAARKDSLSVPTGLQNDTLQQLTMPTSTSFWNLRAAGPERVKRAVPLPCSLLLMMATASSSVSAYMTGLADEFSYQAPMYIMLIYVQTRHAAQERISGRLHADLWQPLSSMSA